MQGRRSRIHAGGDVPQSLAPRQLGEDHADELLAAAEVTDTGLGVVATDQAVESLTMDEVENLGENEAAGVHGPGMYQKPPQNSKASHRISSVIHSLPAFFKRAPTR
jgi:hypothetical protein